MAVYSVSQINSYIKNMFTQDFMLARISIRGEVSNCKYHSSGHIYFTLKDEKAAIACVMFAGNRKGLSFTLKEGQKVEAEGSISVYEQNGSYQLYARKITLDGAGELYKQYENLKTRLEEMGMFAEEYKKPIPQYAMKIGIITAQTGAAVRDIITVAKRRNPYVKLTLYSAFVQGEGAKESIVQGIKALDQLGLDILIVGRGGGSIEDLWAFNEECVARAIFECNTPVISAVGHEVDVTIADYVADLRAPTPSAAAELAVFDLRALEEKLGQYNRRFLGLIEQKLGENRTRLKQQELQLQVLSPGQKLLEKRQRLLSLADRLEYNIDKVLSQRKHHLVLYAQKLQGLSPFISLERGYAYVQDKDGASVRSVKQIKIGEEIQVQFLDGQAKAKITELLE